MTVTRYATAPQYFPEAHEGMRCLRLQGHEAGTADTVWIGMSEIEPAGRTELTEATVEKHYVVLEGEVTVVTRSPEGERSEVVLSRYDSCRIAPHEARQLVNRSGARAVVLLAMPFA